METMKRSITKEEVNQLDKDNFKGTIYVIDDIPGLRKGLKLLTNEKLIGFDTETRPSFTKGVKYDPSLIQIASKEVVLLIRIKNIKIPNALKKFLADPEITKVGIALDRDLKELQDVSYFEPAGFLDLNTYAPSKGFESIGVRKLAALVLGFRVSKRQQTSNWDADILKQAQLEYAATDAWVCREIYLKIKDL